MTETAVVYLWASMFILFVVGMMWSNAGSWNVVVKAALFIWALVGALVLLKHYGWIVQIPS